ncbi:Protein FAM234A [Liparis tanakae]|uniref:Protein FAM234A n=1 Tax=Liparis tanakae TaxID=230148 RepID=A0A4Z2FF72_9TELE|nr:Protein FAM234A [Liparis tanakae]
MDSTGSATEGDPLNRGGDGAHTAAELKKKRKKSCKGVWGISKLTHWRTAVFFFSLFLCLSIVFAFSFIIPCPVRPQYLVTWNRTFPEAATYDFLAIEDVSKDKVMDVLFVLKNTDGTGNSSCDAAGLPSPCVYVLAVDGTDGRTLWARPLAPPLHWAQCGPEDGPPDGPPWDCCLLSHGGRLTAVHKHTGDVRWQQPQPPGLNGSLPVLIVPDLDGDTVSDVALVASDIAQTQLAFLSGKTGVQIGSTVALDATETANHLLYRTTEGSYYVLLQKDTGLYGLALWRIAARARAGMEAGLKKDKHWEKDAGAAAGLVPVYESDSVRQVLRIRGAPPNLLLVTGGEVALVDGKRLQLLWRFNSSSILGEPSFGHFNKDDVLDVVVEEDVGNFTKRVVILNGRSGAVLWEVALLATPNSPRPTSIHTTNSFSVFMFWGMMPSETNSSEPFAGERRSYLLLPLYSKVLLEATSVVLEHIVTFKATLLENGRHAACILLTGPEAEGADGTVGLSKRKMKQDVPDSRVLRLGSGGTTDTSEDIKEAFSRLRFSDW